MGAFKWKETVCRKKGDSCSKESFLFASHPTNGPAMGEETLCSDMVNHIPVTPGSLDDTMEIFSLDLLVIGD